MRIAFDVDGCLIRQEPGEPDAPRWDVLAMLRTLHACGHDIIVWSGGGREYAEVWARRLFIADQVECMEKPVHRAKEGEGPFVDVAFDDEEVTFGKVNVRV